MDSSDLAFAGIAQQAELIAAGEISSVELLDCYLERIARLDPALGAFRVVLDERARAEARQADARRASGDSRPLLGVPIAIKDDTDIAGELTMRGSRAHGPVARADAETVARVRGAGAVVIGKTSVPEMMMFPFTESASFGAARNPWDVSRTPGGSSGGSAAAVAAGLVGGALGSDGGGSIRIPAACCGIFGLKPQRARVPLAASRSGNWHGLSVAGPLARSVHDAALLFDVLSDTGGEFSAAAAREPGQLRIAVSAKLMPGLMASLDRDCAAALDETAELLRNLGHEVVTHDPDYGTMMGRFMARYLRGIHDEAGAMEHPERLEPRTRAMARLGAPIANALLGRVMAAEQGDAARVFGVFERYDVLLTPTLAQLPPKVGRWEGKGAVRTLLGVARFTPYTATWNYLGNPAATVPAGATARGVPLGVQLVAPPHGEATLLALAAQLEAERPWAQRRPPMART